MPEPFPSATAFEVYPADVRIVRPSSGEMPEHLKDCKRGAAGFSSASARRLVQTARNACPLLVSQFVLTYHESNPDGATAKKHLHAWLVALRRALPDVGYLWVLEFQTFCVHHFHVYVTEPPSAALHERLGAAWNRIAEPSSPEHLRWHTVRGRKGGAWIPWDMGSGQYLAKYMSKQAQKSVPEGFGWAGRWWGSSRGLVPPPVVFEPEELGDGVRDITRTLSKWMESKRRRADVERARAGRPRRVKFAAVPRASRRSARVKSGTDVFMRLLPDADVIQAHIKNVPGDPGDKKTLKSGHLPSFPE